MKKRRLFCDKITEKQKNAGYNNIKRKQEQTLRKHKRHFKEVHNMKLFDIFGTPNIDKNLEEYHKTQNAVLLDVRTAEEYAEGHIPKSKNLPLQVIDKAARFIDNKDVPVFVYCKSGGRSSMAQEALKSMGYKKVTNLGGISAYTGKVEY